MKWELTPDEFIHLWRETRRDRYPFPLRLRSSMRWQNDHDHLAHHLNSHYPLNSDPDLSAALRMAAAPAITLALTGTQRTPLRAYAAIDTTVAVTMFQHPGPAGDVGANIIVEAGTPPLIPQVIAAILDPLRAGRAPARTERLAALHAPNHPDSPFTHPHTGHGHIAVHHGLRAHHAPPPEFLSWCDIPADGRYTYRATAHTLELTPCSPTTLTTEVTRLITPPNLRHSIPEPNRLPHT